MPKKSLQENRVSPSVINRLPRYFRYLRILMREGKSRISSGELAKRMNITASQIRQDLNCFGGFGQQGYGYNVTYLYAKICELLGVGAGLSAVVVGAGNLGRAIVRSSMFEKRGVDVVSMFDVNPMLVGQTVNDVLIRNMSELESFCRENHVDIAVLTLPKEETVTVAKALVDAGVDGFWNFTGQELELPDAVVENVHLGDSLMTLCYRLCLKDGDQAKEEGAEQS